jgi:seryl-tRNA(Sec) selenium transferase
LLEEKLRSAEPPVVSRVKDDSVLLDMRTVRAEEVPVLAAVLAAIA